VKRLAPAVFLVIATLIAVYVGAAQIDNFWSALISPGSNEILWQIRIPRVTAALIVGASLALAGLMAQGVCNNALAEPSILGTTAGASLGTVLAVITGLVQVGSIGAIVCGAVGAMAATSLTFKLANLRAQLSSFALIIVGIAVSAILTAVVGLVSAMVTRADARSISFWNFGSLALITRENLVGISITAIVGAIIAWRIAPSLDRLSLGDATAFHLGVDVAKLRVVALVALSLLAGGAVSTVGSIAFIGLAAPHIARFIYGPTHRTLVVHTAIIGAFLVVVADTLARTLAQPNELPIGLVTSLLGAPVLIALVSIKNNVWRTQ
jgi:iron complex transport system permease protein